MTLLDMFLIGFFVGMITSGLYVYHVMKYLKNNGYIVYEITEKFKKELGNGKK